MALAVVRVGETLWRLFVMRLTQQGVETVVQAGTKANVSSVARAVQSAIEVLLWQKRLLVVARRLVDVVLIQSGQHAFICIQ